tara:strand:- start:226 stop:1152 length:927 start_codon:yes stop_codon:yes gene_type:complete
MVEKIFVALSTIGQYGSEPLDRLKKSGVDFDVNSLDRRLTEPEIVEMGSNSTGIIAGIEPYTKNVLDNLPKLRCISRAGAGIDSIDLKYAKENGIAIRNTPEVVVQPVAELTLALILGLLRRTAEYTILMREGKWKKIIGENLFGKIVGIIGTGRIGKALSEALTRLGASVCAYDIQPDALWAKKNSVSYVSFESLLGGSDIISLHASVDGGSEVIIKEKEISKMKKGVMIINTSRGSLLDEQAAYDGLQSGKIGSLGMDVYENEPYEGNLVEFENILMTPHIATFTRESRLEMEVQATQNLLDALGV